LKFDFETARFVLMNLDQFKLKLTAVFEPAPEGGYTCHFEEFPEVFSEGETIEEANANLLDAFVEVLEYHREEARKNVVPGSVREEVELAAS
jgi:predicted RNase H-like HicB family nuclease